MSEGVKIVIETDTSQTEAELQNIETKVTYAKGEVMDLRQDAQLALRETALSVAHGAAMVNSMVGMVRGAVQLLGGALDPIADAVFSIIGTIVSTVTAIATSYLAGGPFTWWQSAIFYGIAAAISIGGTIAATVGLSEARSHLSGAQSAFQSMTSMLY